ncbi:MAG: site-specific DNA-methyltransferase, partial [Wolinella sp.]
EDGVIFISIDDNEQAQLKLLCDEVFGAENFVSNLIVNAAPAGSQSSIDFAQQHQYCVVYRKSDAFNVAKLALSNEELDKKYTERDEFGQFYIERLWKRGIGGKMEDVPSLHFPVYFDKETQQIYIDEEIMQISDKSNIVKIIPYQTKGVLGRWTWSKFKMMNERHKLKVATIADEYKLHKKVYRDEDDGKKPVSIIEARIGRTELGSLEIKNIFNGNKYFDYPKSSDFVKHFIKMQKETDTLILDFFSGSGTTAHAVMQLNAEDGGNRRFICVQLPEETDEKSEARKAGFDTIADIAKERIRRAGRQISDSLRDTQRVDTGFKVFKLAKSNFKQWQNPKNRDSEALKQQISLFQDVVESHATTENMAYELALRLGFPLTDKIEFSENVVWLDNASNTRKTALLLERADQALLDKIRSQSPLKVFALDKVFNGDDALKTNAASQFKDANIAFETL